MTTLRPGEPTPADGWPAWREWYYAQKTSKRFTDAELAAEYWRAEWTFQYDARTAGGNRPDGLGLTAKAKAFHRFVSTPHYDEVQP